MWIIYFSWCHHCQKLAGTWEDLANSFGHEDGVSISKIDCTEHRPICKDFDVKVYIMGISFKFIRTNVQYNFIRAIQHFYGLLMVKKSINMLENVH